MIPIVLRRKVGKNLVTVAAYSSARGSQVRGRGERTQGCRPPSTPDDRQPDTPEDERDTPDGRVLLRCQSDDSRDPEDDEEGDNVDEPSDEERRVVDPADEARERVTLGRDKVAYRVKRHRQRRRCVRNSVSCSPSANSKLGLDELALLPPFSAL